MFLHSPYFKLCIFCVLIFACVQTADIDSPKKYHVHLVIANYNEDVSWIKNVTLIPPEDIFLYQKGNKNVDKQYYTVPNRGNECLPYVTHIVRNYNHSLADFTYFLHGLPQKHCPNILEYLNSGPIYETKQDFLDHKPRKVVFLTDTYIKHQPAALKQSIPDLYPYYQTMFGRPLSDAGTSIWANGQFIVSSKLIKKKPYSFWKDIELDLLSDDSTHGSKHGVYVCGYLEQMWHEIWGGGPVPDVRSMAYVNGKEGAVCNRDMNAPTV